MAKRPDLESKVRGNSFEEEQVTGYTLLDPETVDGLMAIDHYNEGKEDLDETLVLVGGIATQLHSFPYVARELRRDLLRPTSDIDLIRINKQQHREFKSETYPIIQEYLDRYNTSVRKGRMSHEIGLIYDGDERGDLNIHLFRASKKRYDAALPKMRHDIYNSIELELPEIVYPEGGKIRTVRFEDVLAGKSDNLVELTRKGYVPNTQIEIVETLLEGDVESISLRDLNSYRARSDEMKHLLLDRTQEIDDKETHNPRIQIYRAFKHLYDVILLSRTAGEGLAPFDLKYFKDAGKEIKEKFYK